MTEGKTQFGRLRVPPAVEAFFLAPASARPLGALRIGMALTLIAQTYLLHSSLFDFFSVNGLVQGELARYLSVSHTPKVSWLTTLLSPIGLSEETAIYLTCFTYLASLLLLAVGFLTRGASIATWFLHWTLMNTGYSTTYGVDTYAHVFLFYMMWMPVGDAYSLDVRLGRCSSAPSSAARLSIRVLQLHLCITYLLSGIEKASGIQWWNGELLWRALNLPVYHRFDMTWLANWPVLAKVGGWGTLVLELGYCVFIWPKATRMFWVICMAAMHIGIAVFLGLDLFGALMTVFTVAIFGIPAQARRAITIKAA